MAVDRRRTSQENNGRRGWRRGKKFEIPNFFAPENVRLTQVIGVRNSSLFAGNMSHVLVR